METEKDKHLTEKSSSFASKDSKQSDSEHDHDHDPKSKPDPDQEHEPEKGTDDSTPSDSEPPPKEDDPNSEKTEVDNKEDEATEEESPPPPDFDKVCEEIDQFISSLSRAKSGDDDNDDEESNPPDVPHVMDQFAFLVEANIANYDPSERSMKWSHLSEADSSLFFESVDRISKLTNILRKFSSDSKYAEVINRIGGILQRAMSYLEDEFRSLLEDSKAPDSSDQNNDSKTSNQEADQPSPEESNSAAESNNFPGYSEEVMSNLNRLAKLMAMGGYEAECFQVYFVARRTRLEATLHKLGFEKFSIDDIQKMQWEPLEREIDSWNKTVKEFVTVHFTGERKLSEAVFSDDKLITDVIFGNLSRSIMMQLLNFAEAIAMTKRSSEKLFKFLDIYETLRDVIPSMGDLLPRGIANELKSEAMLTRCRLGEAMVCIFCELENSIKADIGKTPVPGGAVHPLTRYTLNYLKYACEFKETLEQVFREHQKIDQTDSTTGPDYDNTNAARGGNNHNSNNNNNNNETLKQSPFAKQISKVMDLLDTNLETKSKLYKDTSLSSIFMMNNGRYILQKTKGSPEIHSLMGDTWSRKRSSDLRNYHKTYQRETWGRLLNCLNHEGLNVNGKVVKPVLKEKFKSFNTMFDEIHKMQSIWVVSDEQLQSELRVSISAVIYLIRNDGSKTEEANGNYRDRIKTIVQAMHAPLSSKHHTPYADLDYRLDECHVNNEDGGK
ncbi:hypothetical protein HYC85_005854 [Camellia sinensis]|uniref:Exocyst subunit Exo70 family protein n=1 Tax=Camellia sinensis TaxID=4442 RepID=A0A7J7I126_CAMSI|nr:hypothetical protein HYC85_005854 [Camellia sinensis]